VAGEYQFQPEPEQRPRSRARIGLGRKDPRNDWSSSSGKLQAKEKVQRIPPEEA
jgi:hypothetical protein